MDIRKFVLILFVAISWVALPAGLYAQGETEIQHDSLPPGASVETAGKMKLALRDGLELQGMPVEVEAVRVNSLFGEASIPLHTIAGIRFSNSADEQTTIVLQNGDVLTGEVHLTELKFVADWGEATVHVTHLASVVFRDDLAWTGVSTPNGQRWRLTRVPPNATPAAPRSYGGGTTRYYRSN